MEHANKISQTCGKTLEEIEVLFSHDGPHAWKTKKGSSHLETDVNNIATAQAKGEARASIERIAEAQKVSHESRKESI